MPQLLLGLHLGAASLDAVAIDATGAVHARATAAYETRSPQPGWAEQRPDDWWRACCEAIAALRAQVALRHVASIGLAGQMHASVFLDAEHEVIRPALLRDDGRAAAEAEEIEREVGAERLWRITGSRTSAAAAAPRLLWLRHNQAIAYKRLRHLLSPKDYLRLHLTGTLATDLGDASATGLLDAAARAWSVEIADALEFDRAILPPVYEGPDVTGTLSAAVASELGLPPGIQVVAGAGDGQAAAVAAGAVTPGIALTSIGTSAALFVPLSAYEPEPAGRLDTMCHSVPGVWHHLGVFPTGADDASSAAMEGVAFSLRRALDLGRAAGARVVEMRIIGGGSTSAAWHQLIADVFETPAVPLDSDDGPAIGAALLGAVGAGAFAFVQEAAAACVRPAAPVEPRPEAAAAYREQYERFRRE
jgi:xylulokinase